MQDKGKLSEIGARCSAIARTLVENADAFGLSVRRTDASALLLATVRDTERSAEAGALIAALCQGGLADADAYIGEFAGKRFPFIRARTDAPRLATLTLQSACTFGGMMLSGPVKLHLERVDEVLYDSDALCGSFCAIIQADRAPDDGWIASLADHVRCGPESLTLLVAPQNRMLGAAQIAGRMNENMIFTMERSLGLDARVVAAIEGYSPVCPPGMKTARGKALLPDDYLHYGAFSRLTLRENAEVDAEQLARNLAFDSLPIRGCLFADLLEEAGGNFFKIPDLIHINKLAVVEVFDPASGRMYRAGSARPDCLV